MKNLLAAVAICLALGAPARASTYAVTTDASSTTLKLNGRLHMQSLSGVEQLVIDSVKGLFTWTYGIQASTMSLTATGNTTYALTMSTGGVVNAGGWTAPWFSASTGFFGSLFGNATSATTATTATNLASGAAGSVPYQTGSGATSFVSSVANRVLSIVGTTPTWLSFLPTSVSISTANVSPAFNGASNFVQMDATAKLPAIDGSQLTNISGVLSGGAAGLSAFWSSATSMLPGVFSETSSSATMVAGSTLTFSPNGTVVNQNTTTNTNGTLLYSASYSSMTVLSFTQAGNGASGSTTFAICNATITLVSHGNPVDVELFGSAVPNAAAIVVPVLLVDGQFVNGESASTGIGMPSDYNFSFTGAFGFKTRVLPSAGLHRYCWGVIANTGATMDFCNTNGATVSTTGCPYMATEVH